jgi:hypothetical protein
MLGTNVITNAIIRYQRKPRFDATETAGILNVLGDLYSREYWNRLWICQEIRASRSISTVILYGSHAIPWESLLALAKHAFIVSDWGKHLKEILLDPGSSTELNSRIILNTRGPSSVPKPRSIHQSNGLLLGGSPR